MIKEKTIVQYGKEQTMAKKFGKFLLFSAAVGAAAAGAYYYFQKKGSVDQEPVEEDEDYDDFSEDLDDEASERNYVSLGKDTFESVAGTMSDKAEDVKDATKTAAEEAVENVEEKIEEFFDDDDDDDTNQS